MFTTLRARIWLENIGKSKKKQIDGMTCRRLLTPRISLKPCDLSRQRNLQRNSDAYGVYFKSGWVERQDNVYFLLLIFHHTRTEREENRGRRDQGRELEYYAGAMRAWEAKKRGASSRDECFTVNFVQSIWWRIRTLWFFQRFGIRILSMQRFNNYSDPIKFQVFWGRK